MIKGCSFLSGMRGSFLASIVPVFVILMILEVIWTKARMYRLNDTISSLSAGIMSMLIANLFMNSVVLAQYNLLRTFLEERGLVIHIPLSSFWTWLLLLLAVDFAYYRAHRWRRFCFFVCFLFVF